MENKFYKEGYDAYFAGKSNNDNPYKKPTEEYYEWKRGFRAGIIEDIKQDPDGN